MIDNKEEAVIYLDCTVEQALNYAVANIDLLDGFHVNKIDESGIILFEKKRTSFFSLTFGERLRAEFKSVAGNKTKVYISSVSKLGTELAARRDNRRNVQTIADFMFKEFPAYIYFDC